MPTASEARLKYEAAQTSHAMGTLTDSGDHTTFTSSNAYWSQRSGYSPEVLPNGIVNGGEVSIAASGSNNVVDAAAALVNLNGVETSVSADTDLSITRPATAVSKINSITIDNSGTYAVVAGTDGATTAFSSTRGGAGGPPYIPVDSVAVAQIRVISDSDAAITASEIFSLPGTHREESNYPAIDVVDYRYGKVTLADALPLAHTGDLPKRVYASYAVASMANVQKCVDFVPPGNSASVNSKQIYGQTIAATSVSLGQGSFKSYPEDGVTDGLVSLSGETLWFQFYPDRLKNPFHAVQGRLDFSRTFPADDQIELACTISAETIGTDHAS
jgi:hypothetical protein